MSTIEKIKSYDILANPLYHELVEKIKQRIPFAFSRFGDGEVKFMLNKQIKPAWGGKVKAVGKELFKIFQKDSGEKYYKGVQPLALKLFEENLKALINPRNTYVNSDILHIASRYNQLSSFLEALKAHPDVTLVGPKYLANLEFYNRHLGIPVNRCWEFVDTIEKDILKAVGDLNNKLILFCASAASNILIDRFAQRFPKSTLIDTGSVFEPYVGKSTRTYHQRVLKNLKSSGQQHDNE